MFLSNKQAPPPPPPPDPSGIKVEVKLSEATVIKLISIAVAVLLSSGVLVVRSAPSPSLGPETPIDAVEIAPDNP